ncbi:MAG: recombination protein RecR [Oligoflexia bacterium]|nr:recombination protein RecR [Oligoflexia bacterium]
MVTKLPEKILRLNDFFSRWPGVGEKTALRFTLGLLKWSKEDISKFASTLTDLLSLQKCEECGIYSDFKVCQICSSNIRKESKVICVVESLADYLAIERSGFFDGVYHILEGVLAPLQDIGPSELTIDKLLLRIRRDNIEEVILALNPSVEGDITSSYIREQIAEGVKVKRIGLGIPMGGNLEYFDTLTINKALENSKAL